LDTSDIFGKRWKLDPEFSARASKVVVSMFQSSSPATIRAWWSLFGALFWVARVYCLPMCRFFQVRQWMRSLAVNLDHGVFSWDTSVFLPSRVRLAMGDLVHRLVVNPWESWVVSPFLRVLYTDASVCGGAFLGNDCIHFFPWGCRWPTGAMPWLELRVILRAIKTMAPRFPRSTFHVFTDSLSSDSSEFHQTNQGEVW